MMRLNDSEICIAELFHPKIALIQKTEYMEDVVFKVYATENNEQWWASKYKYFLLVFFPPNMMIHSRTWCLRII